MEIKKIELIQLNYSGVKLNLRINYDKSTLAFVNEAGSPQKFEFAERGTEYLGGWIKILDGIARATRYGNDKLIEHKRILAERKTDRVVNIFAALAETDKAGFEE